MVYNLFMEDYILKLKSYPPFLEYEKQVIGLINKLDTNDGLDSLSNEMAGEEGKLRARCKKKLYELLEPFINFQEKQEPTEEQINKAKAKYIL